LKTFNFVFSIFQFGEKYNKGGEKCRNLRHYGEFLTGVFRKCGIPSRGTTASFGRRQFILP
jgi:hypothetical protein